MTGKIVTDSGGSAMSFSFLRGALVSFTPTFGVPLPNVIVFQFNPETITHSWSESETTKEYGKGGNPLATVGYPPESFSFTLSMNSDSDMAGERRR